VRKNDLPGFRLEQVSSAQGKDMLLMERTEKRTLIEAKETPVQEAQLVLIERSPLEEAWENVLELMRKQIGAEQVKAWLEKLQLGELVDGTLTYRANLKFVADWVETNFRHKLEAAWQSMGHPVTAVRIETKGRKSAA
jgi:hypothetical protein